MQWYIDYVNAVEKRNKMRCTNIQKISHQQRQFWNFVMEIMQQSLRFARLQTRDYSKTRNQNWDTGWQIFDVASIRFDCI